MKNVLMVLLFLSLGYSEIIMGEAVARIDLYPTKDMVSLKIGKAENGYIRHPEWIKDAVEKAASLTSGFKAGNDWETGIITFTPENDGIAKLAIMGNWAKTPEDQIWVLFDDIKTTGIQLVNGGFEDGLNGWHGPRGAKVSNVAVEGNQAALVNLSSPLGQNIILKAKQPVSITFRYKAENPGEAVSIIKSAKIGDVVFSKSFSEDYNGWLPKVEPWAKIVPDGRGGKCVEITAMGTGKDGVDGMMDVLGNVDKSEAQAFLLTGGIPLKNLKGYQLEVEVGVKAENVPRPPKPWEGIRLVINYATSTKAYSDCYYNMYSGTFDWKTLKWIIRIPSDVKNMSMSLGLISPTGKVYFDHVKMTVADIPFSQKTPLTDKAHIGHKLPRLRGFTSMGDILNPKTLNDIADNWKANIIKAWFLMKGSLEHVDTELDKYMSRVDAGLKIANEKGIYAILHVDTFWDQKERGGNELLYEKKEYAEKFIECWKKIANHFKGRKEIYAFELLNESHVRMPITEDCYSYLELMDRTAQEINKIDPERTIIVQPEEWWGTSAFYKMRPIKAKNIVYAVHFYDPFNVTHQGIREWYAKNKSYQPKNVYPGKYNGVEWNKETLRQALAPVLEFQKAYNVHIIASEFSCVRWAPNGSSARLIGDMISLFEEYGWDWTYHGYPEFTGWRPDHGSDMWSEKIITNPPTDTEVVLKTWFAKNKSPNFKEGSQ